MKKILSLALNLALLFVLTACAAGGRKTSAISAVERASFDLSPCPCREIPALAILLTPGTV